ncbi:uncharacterized protein LOC111313239 [Durio zibethinus]|uniref:Uncharacterized protein LOC111313239 n=1 Tax=Durio zibethinus TaxID=66656 RepID=A0A6P6AXN7_DURZI|nr:uncharacterized protein LOC111313239 [Durio zibethinus]
MFQFPLLQDFMVPTVQKTLRRANSMRQLGTTDNAQILIFIGDNPSQILQENFSEDPLKLWKCSPRYCELTLQSPKEIIRVKPMIYTKQDIDEFEVQISELLDKGLIEPTTSPHSSPTFMVRNHSEIKRGFWQIMLNETSKPLAAFSAPAGHYQWTVMLFGLCNAPQIF